MVASAAGLGVAVDATLLGGAPPGHPWRVRFRAVLMSPNMGECLRKVPNIRREPCAQPHGATTCRDATLGWMLGHGNGTAFTCYAQ